MSHELGHCMGGNHGKLTDGRYIGESYPYSHGYRVKGSLASIMAYIDETDPDMDKMDLYASPQLDCKGLPCGTAEKKDVRRLIKETGPVIATFYQRTDAGNHGDNNNGNNGGDNNGNNGGNNNDAIKKELSDQIKALNDEIAQYEAELKRINPKYEKLAQEVIDQDNYIKSLNETYQKR